MALDALEEAAGTDVSGHDLSSLGTMAQPSPDVTLDSDEETGGWVYGAGGSVGEAEELC